MEKPLYIAAIDLGSYQIVGAVAEKQENGHIKLLAVDKVFTRKTSIVKGRINDVSEILYEIISIQKKLFNQFKVEANRIYLSCSGLFKHADDPLWKNLIHKLNQSKIEVIECPNVLALEADLALTPEEQEEGSLYVNIGGATTSFVFRKLGNKDIQNQINIGGGSITNDLTTLKLTEEEAEKLKCKLGNAQPSKLEHPGTIIGLSKKDAHGNQRSIARGDLSRMIEDRIIDLAQRLYPPFIHNHCFEKGRTHIVLSGGCTHLRNYAEWTEEYTSLPCRVSTLADWVEEDEYSKEFTDASYSTLIALLVNANTSCVKTTTSHFQKFKKKFAKGSAEILDQTMKGFFPDDN